MVVLVITKKYESMTKLFVCYHAVTALTERFCQNAFAPREAMAAKSRACQLRSNSAVGQLLNSWATSIGDNGTAAALRMH